LSKKRDILLLIQAAEAAWTAKAGIWEGQSLLVLLGYEARICKKLGDAENADEGIVKAFERVCVDVLDLSSVGEYGFYTIPPCYRLWV
jgi:hypothetical protein